MLRLFTLGLPLIFLAVFIIAPLLVTFVVSFWVKSGFSMKPALTLVNYHNFFKGVRLVVFERSLWVAFSSTIIMLLIAYPIAYVIATRVREAYVRSVLFLFAVPFLVSYIIRTFAWADILGRTGPANQALMFLGLTNTSVDWLLYSDFSVYLGLITAYMPFMIFPIWLSLAGRDHRLAEASWILGEPPLSTFWRITFPLSLPGVLAAAIFGFVGAFGEVAISKILGGTGYQLLGNTITSALDILHYPLAATISSIATGLMLVLIILWYRSFDIRLFVGHLMGRN